MKNNRTRKLSQRVRYALIAGMAGAFLIPQVGFAAPTGEHDYTSGVDIQRPNATTTTITATAQNNVINWRDYSVNHGETVQYDNGVTTGAAAHNYLNIVTGANTSNINGEIKGGNHVYIVNPNGVIFGKGAEVNVGHLHVSTQDGVSSTAKTAFESAGTSPLVNNATLKADVVNMGKITATTVEVHGSHIRFLNAADVHTAANAPAPVKVYTAAAPASANDPDGGYAHIGYRTAAAPTNYTVHTASVSPEYYKLVKDKTELDAINSSTATLAGNYMLEQDIDLGGAAHTPIGGNSAPGAFTGKFDGNFFRVKNFKVSNKDSAGLFGNVSGGRIENLGVAQATVAGLTDASTKYAGGLAGYASNNAAQKTIIKNTYVTDSTITGRAQRHGGLVGAVNNTVIDGSYTKVTVDGGGVLGLSGSQTLIQDTYTEVTPKTSGNETYFVHSIMPHNGTTIKNSYAKATKFSPSMTNLTYGTTLFRSFLIDSSDQATDVLNTASSSTISGTASSTYTADAAAARPAWDLNNDGAPGAKWRIYEGRTLPLLTAFMNGRVDSAGSVGVEYKYRKFNKDGTLVTGFAQASNNHADVPTGTLTYDSKIIKIVDGSDGIVDGSTLNNNVTYDKTLTSGQKNRVTTYTDTNTSALDRDNNIRNAGTKAMIWSDQDGPNLRGVNITIDKRKINVGDSTLVAKRMYDGTRDVKDAFEKALKNGGLTASGFTDEDLNDTDPTRKITITPSSDFTATLDNKNVGKNKRVTFTGKIEFGGTNKGNYELGDFDFSTHPNIKGWAEITKAPLILKVLKDSANKVYDGTNTVTDVTMKANPNVQIDQTLTRVINGNTVVANIKNGGAGGTPDDVSMDTIPDPTYVKPDGTPEIHAGTHTIRYTNVKLKGTDAGNYELYYQMPDNTQTEVKNDRLDLTGTIERRRVKVDDFNVYDKTTHAKVDAKKVYDGNDEYTPSSNVYISSNAVTGDTTGIVDRDRDHITFTLKDGKGHFAQNDGTTYSKNVQDVEKLAYEVTGHTDDDTNYKLSDYYIMDGGVKKSLGSTFHATGAGKITPKALTATVKNNHITKVYDAMDDQTDGNRNITRGDDLVTLDGFATVNGVKESRTNTSTAKYASPNVVWDGVNNRATTQGVTYTASFDPGTGVESKNYTLGVEGAMPISTTKALTGSYTGTITPRPLGIKFADVTKVYDGTTDNPTKTITDIDDSVGVMGATKGAVTSVDGTTAASVSSSANMANVTSSYSDENAGTGKTVTYTNLSALLSNHNYSVADAQTGKGTITRRLIENSGFQVRKTGGTPADATKVYDGKTTFTLAGDEYLVAKPSTDPSATPGTGIVAKDVPNIVFKMTGNEGHFLKSGSGTAVSDRTTHVSEARRVAYGVYAETLDGTTSPLSNYEFGTTGSKRKLEAVTAANPDAVTAAGRITPAQIQATTREITKLYDGMAEHMDGNRDILSGSNIVGLNLIADATGQPTNTSTAAYADQNVARDALGNVIKKNVTYKAQLTGQYANDYQIVNAGNNVISTESGSGATRTVTATITPSAATGTIKPRKLKITMNNVTKTYDGTAKNTSATVTGITDDPASTVINTILTNDGVSAGSLQTTYNNMLTANTASSNYGRLSGTNFTTNANASNGTPHDVQYANMDDAFRSAFSAVADNYDVDENVYSKGTINRKAITPNTFKVSGGKATKVYDGTSAYTVPAGSTLTANTGELVGTDASKIQFAISGNGAKFMKTDGLTETANVADARKVAYNITATGDADTLRNYTLNGQNLESGNLTASGDGEITRRALNLNLVQSTGIDKEYDGQTTLKNTATKNWNALTDADPKGNVQYAAGSTAANKLVTTDGTSFNITSNYMNNAGTVADKNVRRDGSNNPIDKAIQYRVTINGDANNYSFDGGTTSAAGGLTLSATGTITPKDLSGAFKKVTKVYDRTTNVPAGSVGFTPGATITGDVVNLATHTAAFHSANVNGDGINTWKAPDGTEQKNWVEYSGLTLGGTDAGNYNLSSPARGLGEITPFALNPSNITFNIVQATKEYDGLRTVKKDDSAALTDVKNYITSATTTVNSTTVNVLPSLKVDKAEYDTKDVDGGRSANRVTYTLKYEGADGNFTVNGGSFTKQGNGVITKKDVTATVKSPVSKVYNATKTVVGVAKNSANTVVTNANDLIEMTGFTGNDGATYTATAQYADKNVGTGKQVDYTLTLNGAVADNYNLKYNGANNAGAFSTNDNTITKRTVDVTFDPVTKSYDGTPTNNSITPRVSSADAAVLALDSSGNVSGTTITNLSNVSSEYGTLSGGTFTPNPNAGDKTVRYQGVGTAMGTVFGANNYDFNVKDGTGRINRAKINAGNVVFDADDAHKTYDGTPTVKYGGSSANSEVRKYINRIGVTLNGNWINLQNDVTMDSAEYSDVNATNGTKHRVTYKFHLNNSNIDISGDNTFSKDKEGIIDRRVLNLGLKKTSGIDKIYDATRDVHNTDERHYDAFVDHDAKGNVVYTASTTTENKLVRKKDGTPDATVNVEAAYADKNVARSGGVVSNRDINYTVKIDAAHGGLNYQLSDGTNPAVDAEVGLTTLKAEGKITPRKLTLDFADVQKPYDTKEDNANKTVRDIGGDDDGRRAATLAADGITKTTFNMTNVGSLYGAGNTDATFHKDPNVVTDANGNVVENGKDVQYTNLAGTLAGQSYAGNYEIVNTAYGKGTIRKRTVSVNNFNFNISNATKEYDGTKDVEYVEGGKTYKDLPHLKKRFQTSTLDLGGGNTVPINLDDITLTGAKYNDERVAHAAGINYDVTINAQNFEFNGGRDKRIEHTGDTITKRDLATKLPPHLVKEYDGEDSFTETNTVFANAIARANLTGVVDRDKNKIRLAVNGRYDSPDASAETREEAEARTPAQAGRNVRYDLTLSGDTDTLSNYKIGTVETLDSDGKMRGVGSGKADIYKKTLTVGVDNIDKLYDGTRTVVRPNGTDTLPHPEAGKFRLSGFVGSESFSFDQTAADKIDGLYSDPNVSRRNGAVVDKDISYSGIKTAFANYAGHDPTGYAKNYRVDIDTLSGKGKILPRPITANEITNGLRFDEATKVYDGTTKLKYNGQNTPDALKNYLKSATVNVDGTPINIRDDLTIRADEAYTHYDTQHVAGGAQPRVTYTLNYTGDNFDISGDLTKTANGVITKRKVTAFAPGQLTKVYDASEKVYDPRDTSIKTYRRGTRVTDGDSIVRMSTEDGDTGLLANDGVRNISTATFDDKNVGKRKKVTYNVAVDSTHAGDYEIVDTLGNTISEMKTRNNEITPRPLDLTFDRVDKDYDGTSTNEDMPATRVTDSDTRRTLGRDRARIFNDELIMQDAAGNDLTLPSDYGYGSTDRSFTPDANANQAGEPDKSVQYRNMGDALRTILGDNAKNYEFKETGYGKGWINKAKVSERDFRLNFKDAVREYDGTSNVDHAIDHLQDDSRWKSNKMLKSDIASVTGTYMSPNGSTPDKNAADRKIVDYKVRLNERNFDFGSWDGVVSAEGGGAITKRKIIAETPRYLTKEYDGTKDIVGKAYDAEGNRITSDGDGLITFRHYNETSPNKYDAADGLVAADTAGNTVRNATTALYADKNVAWKGGAWKNGHGDVADKDVNYALTLTGTDAKNYEIMNEVVNKDGTKTKAIVGKGKITPKDIHLKADPQTRWINEGLPDSYSGTPMGSNLGKNDVPELVPGEVLPGQIEYSSPNAELRWNDYAINGTYRAPKVGTRYQLPDGTWTTQSFAGGDGDAVSRNYRFVQDPANKSAFHMGPYVPDYEYYKAMTQVSKMTPDEYAYENASLDRRSNFGRDAEAEIDYMPPSVNTIKDGVDITQTGIHVTDETVFSLVNEVFGER